MDADMKKFLCPEVKDVDMVRTKENVGAFLSQYLSCRQSIGQPREPKITTTFSLTPISSNQITKHAEDILIYNEEMKAKFLELHKKFVFGYSAIRHPFRPDITKRRQRIFYERYILGYSIYVTAERNLVSDDLVSQDSTLSVIMFAQAIGIIVMKG